MEINGFLRNFGIKVESELFQIGTKNAQLVNENAGIERRDSNDEKDNQVMSVTKPTSYVHGSFVCYERSSLNLSES